MAFDPQLGCRAVMPEFSSKTIRDKSGRTLELSCCTMGDIQGLVNMYEAFSPKAITQGLPPFEADARVAWIRNLLEKGQNFQAKEGDDVIGHSSLIAHPGESRGEYVIFVNQKFRNSGLGTALTQLTVERARELGLEAIWLTVEALNFRAIKLYKKVGFQFCDSGERERTMILRL